MATKPTNDIPSAHVSMGERYRFWDIVAKETYWEKMRYLSTCFELEGLEDNQGLEKSVYEIFKDYRGPLQEGD